jgi:hypothetical protein
MAACLICQHSDPHKPHPDGEGWPSTVLRCESCPDGKCQLPGTIDFDARYTVASLPGQVFVPIAYMIDDEDGSEDRRFVWLHGVDELTKVPATG